MITTKISTDPSKPLTKTEASALTNRIRKHIDSAWSDITRAYEGKAWKAMGYGSWEAYVKAEFDIGRSRSYQLIDAGKVVAAVKEAAGRVSTVVDISERDARDIKTDLAAVTDDIKSRVDAGQEPAAAVKEAVESKRAEKDAAKQRQKEQQAAWDRQQDEAMSKMPSFVQQHEAAKQAAIAKRKEATPTSDHDDVGLTDVDRIAELQEAVAVLEKEAETLRTENKLYGEMKVQFAQGGFEKVIAGKDEEIRVLESRLYRESADKASWMKSAKYWQEQAVKLGWSKDEVIPFGEPAS